MAKKKKQHKTFADRARELVKKYPRASFDPIEKRELDEALAALQEEQDAFKIKHGIRSQAPNEPEGAPTMLEKGTDPEYMTPVNTELWPSVKYDARALAKNLPFADRYSKQSKRDPEYTPVKTELWPTIASGATSLAGNLLLANRALNQSRRDLVKPRTMVAPTIDLSRARTELASQSALARTTAMRNLRDASTSRGQLLAGTAATSIGLNRALSGAMADSYNREAELNFNAQTRAAEMNAQLAAEADRLNAQNRMLGIDKSNEYLAGAFEVPGQVTRDINQIKEQDRKFSAMGGRYKWVDYVNPKTGRKERRMIFLNEDGETVLVNWGQ
jgi:hypothetical protein